MIYDGALVPADDTYSATTVVNTWIGVGQTSDAVYQALPPVSMYARDVIAYVKVVHGTQAVTTIH